MVRMATDDTGGELIFVCSARQVADGDVFAQGIVTPLAMAGYLLRCPTINLKSGGERWN
ncbi:MAG: hypothetical protein ISS49_06280 [Anaerolineae bacterium]|nr:hypothetical protein [Anaerolineae bacterium]